MPECYFFPLVLSETTSCSENIRYSGLAEEDTERGDMREAKCPLSPLCPHITLRRIAIDLARLAISKHFRLLRSPRDRQRAESPYHNPSAHSFLSGWGLCETAPLKRFDSGQEIGVPDRRGARIHPGSGSSLSQSPSGSADLRHISRAHFRAFRSLTGLTQRHPPSVHSDTINYPPSPEPSIQLGHGDGF